MKILHLIDALDYSGSARQIHLLGPALARDDFAVEVCSLGPAGPWTQSLVELGVTVHTLDWTRWFDPSVLWNLRDILCRFAPDLVHVWRLPALRALALVARDLLPRVVMSAPLPPRGGLAWWDRELLKRVRCLAVAGVSDQEQCVRQGVVAPTLRVVAPAVESVGSGQWAVGSEARSDSCQLPTADCQLPKIICVGKLEREEGMRDAIWAFDLLRFLYPEHQLVFVGAGSMQPALHALSLGMGQGDKVQFLGNHADVAALLRSAPVAWIPSAANCGRQVALEAMAAGCAVVATDVPCMRDIIIPGETGFLTTLGDVTQPARVTCRLFQDAPLLERIRQAARRQVAQRHAVAEVARRWRELYQSAA